MMEPTLVPVLLGCATPPSFALTPVRHHPDNSWSLWLVPRDAQSPCVSLWGLMRMELRVDILCQGIDRLGCSRQVDLGLQEKSWRSTSRLGTSPKGVTAPPGPEQRLSHCLSLPPLNIGCQGVLGVPELSEAGSLFARMGVGSHRSEVLASPGLVVVLILPHITAFTEARPSARHRALRVLI